ncbi:MAG: transporter [Dissulfurispiraceae bacterium]|nr:transporter [Dissulfurispiraceae bacterium]
MKRLSILYTAVLMFVILLFAAPVSFATESGGGAYPLGAEDFMSGAVPPPGTYFINYFLYYHGTKFRDGDGNRIIPDFDLKGTANVFRLIHITKHQILGANWGMHVFLPFKNVNVTMNGRHESKAGLGDIIVDPILLSWHSKNWHFAAGLDIYLPTGDYDKNSMANPGRNYWTFEPIIGATYTSDNGWDVSAKLMYDFNTKNTATDYLSGQEFHFDYTIGKKMGAWSLGLGGYYYRQVTDDRQYGVKVGTDGNKGQVFAFGPQVKYDYKNMSFILKYQTETLVENKPDGSTFWFKFVCAL